MRILLISLPLLALSSNLSAENFKKFSEIDEPLQSMLEDSVILQDQHDKTLKSLLHEIRLLRHEIQESNKNRKIEEVILKQNHILEKLDQTLNSSIEQSRKR
ncbi:MAG: hypothetical protein F9K49_07605 [Caedimonadaceae bacterium]|nr:MAG: hypothetical protein F9K49_07605 [Caedimonadaceae bacterium]